MNNSRVQRIVAIVAVVVVVVAVFLFLRHRYLKAKAEGSVATETPVAALPTPTAAPSLEERLSERLKGVTLATSDAAVQGLVGELSSHPELAAWLVNEDLVRRFTAAVQNVADGASPRGHLDFLRPEKPFAATKRHDKYYVDEQSYTRYDLVVEVFTSLDTEGTITLYRELRPLIDEAYREIAPPNASFDEALDSAIDELLAVPSVSGPIELGEKVVTYAYTDPYLETLSDAQRHLLRMGPDNVRRVQEKLRELRGGVGG